MQAGGQAEIGADTMRRDRRVVRFPQRGHLAHVGVLAAGHLVAVDIGGARADVRLEGRVEAAHALPVHRGLVQRVLRKASIALGAGECGHDGRQVGL